MKMVGEYGESEQIDAHRGGQLDELLLDPAFAVIEVFSGNRIIAEQEAAHHPIHNMDGSDLNGSEDLPAS